MGMTPLRQVYSFRKDTTKQDHKTPAHHVVCPSGPAASAKGAKNEVGLVHSHFEDPMFSICFKHQDSSASLTLSYVALIRRQ